MADYELDRLLVQVRRIEEHRAKGAEAKIRKTYQELLKELRHYLADGYTSFAEDDALTYDILQKHGYYARFLEEVEKRVNDISPEVRRLIRSTVEQTYESTYNGMVESVKKAAQGQDPGRLKGCTPDIIKRAVENPVSKLTLNDRLEKHRKDIVYDIKQNINVGLMNGDRYSTMANRIKQSVEGNYKKAIRIARTETHRVQEAGNQDAAISMNDTLKESSAGIAMVKTWRTMKDERVRPAGKIGGKAKQYDHRKMDGVTIPVDEEFTLPSGAKTMAPGQSGVAGEDINCRCYLSYGLQKVQESDKIEIPKNGTKEAPINVPFEPAQTVKEANSYAKNILGVEAEYKGLDIRCANEWNQGLSRMKEKFPELFAEKIKYVGESHARNTAVKQYVYSEQLKKLEAMGYTGKTTDDASSKYATSFIRKYLAVGKGEMASSWTPSGQYAQFSGICMNKGFFGNFDDAIKSKEYQVSVKWKPQGTATIKGTFDHEFGHQLDAWLGIGKQDNIKKLYDNRTRDQIKEDLSEYAWNNGNRSRYSEMIAEGWTEYCNNPNPRPMAREIGETIERLYEEWKEKNM